MKADDSSWWTLNLKLYRMLIEKISYKTDVTPFDSPSNVLLKKVVKFLSNSGFWKKIEKSQNLGPANKGGVVRLKFGILACVDSTNSLN